MTTTQPKTTDRKKKKKDNGEIDTTCGAIGIGVCVGVDDLGRGVRDLFE